MTMRLDILLRQLFYIRYPLLFAVVLAGIGPIAIWPDSPVVRLLANVILVHNIWQTAVLTAVCLTAAALLSVQAHVIFLNGPFRFADLLGPEDAAGSALRRARRGARWIVWNWNIWRTAIWLIVGWSLPVSALVYSWRTQASAGNFPHNVSVIEGLGGLAAGTAAFLLITLLVSWINSRVIDQDSTVQTLLPIGVHSSVASSESASDEPLLWRIDHFVATLFGGPGYSAADPRTGRSYLRPGHWQQIVFLVTLVLFYVVLFFVTRRTAHLMTWWTLPTAFFAVLGLMFLASIFAGASFLLDHFRIPTLLLVVLAEAASFWFTGRDHTFEIKTAAATKPSVKLVNAIGSGRQAIPPDGNGERTLVVVTAPGGGIHASVWTARVLTGLHSRYGEPYTRSLKLVSAVSGGSVGSLFYAANFDQLNANLGNKTLLEADCRAIVERSGGSGLEAVGWGTAFPDLMGLFPLLGSPDDRGAVLDRAWRERLRLRADPKAKPLMLSDWSARVQQGHFPIVVFNATDVNSGRRILFSPVVAGPRTSLAGRAEQPYEFAAQRSGQKSDDIDVVTAARLSATFPYVTPTARPAGQAAIGYVADGGYIDNEGIVTAVDWISRLVTELENRPYGERPFDRILVLRIRHIRPGKAVEETQDNSGSGFLFAVGGPAKAMLTVRNTSQQERGQVEADLITRVAETTEESRQSKQRQIENFAQQIGVEMWRRTVDDTDEPAPPITVEMVFLDYTGEEGIDAPLSWKLTPSQFASYDAAWKRLVQNKGLARIDGYFTPLP